MAQYDEVYCVCMSRTNIDLDEEAVEAVMERFQFSTKRDAVNFALRSLAAEPMSTERAHRMRGSGWAGDLDSMRESRQS
jgi:Arc/MetJ family transcription regulator